MSNLPLLVLPKVTQTLREKGSSKYFGISTPSPSRQRDRLGDRFDHMRDNLSKSGSDNKITDDSGGIYPDKTIVFELAQPKPNFKRAVEKIGLSWVGEDDVELVADEDFRDPRSPKDHLEGRMYLTCPDQKSLNDLVTLWGKYVEGKLPTGYGDWKEVFSHLKDIRRWGPKDRLPADTQRYLSEGISEDVTHLHLEVEAIFFGENNKDNDVKNKLSKALLDASAEILDSVTIPEIRYHAVLISISKSEVYRLQSFESALLNIDEIGYIRPQSMSSIPLEDSDYEQGDKLPSPAKKQLRPPVAALFDGVPIQEHDLLKDRLIVNDPEALQKTSPVNTRSHGTAMASLILHGDLPLKQGALTRKLYVHCLLSGTAESSVESTNKDKLIIGLIYEGLVNIANGSSKDVSEIFIINLSLGDVNRPFVGSVSAWARLIDYMSWEFGFLFVVSAGNISTPVALNGFSTPASFKNMSLSARRAAVIEALEGSASLRTIFSPAEAVNAITVGASHSDAADKLNNNFLIDPYDSDGFPSVINGIGLGYKRSVKPDILHSGGRALLAYGNGATGLHLYPGAAGKYFGQEVAGVKSTTSTTRAIGTSNSAALVTRAAVQIYDNLEKIIDSNSGFSVNKKQLPCLVKALVVHSAHWGDAGNYLESIIKPREGKKWKSRRTNVTRFMGYGLVDFSRVLNCTEHRVTLLGVGELAVDKAEIFSFPLPPSISSIKAIRRLTVTLAWVSPIRPGEQNYRAALLDVVPADKDGFPIGAQRVTSRQPPGDVSRRGTVVHEIFEGEDAVPVIDGDALRLRVECRTQGGSLGGKIPYGIAVTFEIADTVQANIYQEIASRIAIKPTPRVRT
ncbi:S8 family peptidase [Burkholderia contaminans]|uniref:S8 family peptidase n=1 Tax=Burkholderia contaminans TaxID=488447 RepID=UPI0009D72F46|nr:S8 family peptidase [Burkholderia contaminans]